MTSNPFTAAVEMQQSGLDAVAEYARKNKSLTKQIERVADVEVGMTPSEVVYEENKLELLHYKPEEAGIEPETTHEIPILIVYALINKPYILDLQPDRSVVRRLLEAGFDVYLIDWGEPSLLDSQLTLDDYVSRYIDNCVEVVRERSGQEEVNLLGYCMGGTMSVMYAALFPEKVRNIGLMAAGLCFSGTGGVLELWGEQEYYDAEQVAETFGNVPADFLDAGFALMDPVSNYVTKYLRLYDNIDDDDFVENFARMERWLNEGIDVAGKTYQQFLEDIYQDNKLARNELYLNGRHVDLETITMPIVQVVGEYDHLIPPESSKPFNELVASDDTTTIEARTGHIGLSVSSKSHAELWPQVAEWFAERSGAEAGPEGDDETSLEESDRQTVERGGGEPSEPVGSIEDEGEPVIVETDEEPIDAEPESAETDEELDETGAGSVDADIEATEAAEEVEATEVETDYEAAEKVDEVAETEPSEEPTPRESTFRKGMDDAESEPEPLESLHGIGPRYAERLHAAGIDGIADLAAADADELAEETGISADRVVTWIGRAADRSS